MIASPGRLGHVRHEIGLVRLIFEGRGDLVDDLSVLMTTTRLLRPISSTSSPLTSRMPPPSATNCRRIP